MTQITPLPRRRARAARAATAALLGAGLVVPIAGAASASPGDVAITVLSGRADLVSGGDALLRVSLPAGATGLRVTAGSRDVTSAFGPADDGTTEGLVDGLAVGSTVVTATVDGARGARITLVDHPIGGPTFSGPQVQPWACQAGATDAQCDAPTVVSYTYEPVGTTTLQSYDPGNPPPSTAIASATTDTGTTVPFIVREETGYSDRDQFATAVLDQPAMPWTPLHEQPQWNQKLVLTHGASCDTTYGVGTAPSVEDTNLLGHGYVLASHALDNAGHNCDIATEAESLVMTKEHVAKTYGAVKWTIGSGCSGGSLVQQQVANAYPGVYQAITPQCSFTDAWSSSMEYEDYVMLLAFFKDATRSGTDAYGPTQIQSIIDHPNPGNPVTFTTAIPNSGAANRSCPSVPASQVYNAQTNPGGVKCTLQQYEVNIFGTKADGFANRPFDNVGIQYGLSGVLDGTLSPQQFADVNGKIGGFDEAGAIETTARVAADDQGLQRVYSSGAADTASNLNNVAIIDLRGPDNGSFHDVYRTYAMRARLLRNFGTAANQVLWRGQVDVTGDVNFVDQSVVAADRWVAAFEADTRSVPLSQKIIEDKPTDLTDRCTNGAGTAAPAETCDATVVAYGTPRMAAGMPLADDTLKCQLKPLLRSDYGAVTFTDAQWAEIQSAFPTGVCNYNAAPVDFRPTTPWLEYSIVGGRPLGADPVSVPAGASDTTPGAALPEAPYAALLPVLGLGAAAVVVLRRRRRG